MSNNDRLRRELTFTALAPSLMWIVGGVYFFAFSFNIKQPLTLDKFDPGPALLPKLLGLALLGGGVFSVVRFLAAGQGFRNNNVAKGSARIATAVLAFILLMPVLGFHLSCSMFSIISMWLMKVPWWQAFLGTTMLVVIIHLVFIELFMIALPTIAIDISLF